MLKLNLLPLTLRPKLVINIDTIFFIVFVISLSAIGMTYLRIQTKDRRTQSEVTLLESQKSDQQKLIEELRGKEAKKDTTSTQSLIVNRKKWNPVLKELTYILPMDVWLTKMTVRNDKNIVDMELSGLAASQKSITRLLGRMERSVSFQNIKLNNSSFKQEYTPSLYSFDFSIPDVYSSNPNRMPANEGKK